MRRYITVVLVFLVALSLVGCGSWREGKHISVTPHPQQDAKPELGELHASSYEQMRDALSQLIADGADKGMIFLADMEESVSRSYMDAAVRNVTQADPVAVYAVEEINYEMGTNTGRDAIAVEITYKRSKADLLRIKRVENMTQVEESIASVLEQAGNSVVLRVDAYETMDYMHFVQQYADENPASVMECPQIVASVYPETGSSRVVELSFSYRTDSQMLLHMKQLVWPIFTAAELYVQGGTDPHDQYAQLYSFLMERHDYTFAPVITPAYSVLQEGIGDSHAFACVYSAMCEVAGLHGRVIYGTRGGEAWYWNQIEIDGTVYYLDLLQSNALGEMHLLQQTDMVDYVWDETATEPSENQEKK